MASISAYRMDNETINEEHKPHDPAEEARQLERPFSERMNENMKIKVLER
jgi:hypothetical protein